MRTVGVVAAAGVAAVLGVLAALAAPATGAKSARRPAVVVWTGTITISYRFERRDPAPARTHVREWRLRIAVDRRGRAVATAKFHDDWTSQQNPQCPATTTHAGAFRGAARLPRVEFDGSRYRVVYRWPLVPMTITEKSTCGPTKTRRSRKDLGVKIPLGGTSPPHADVIGGTLTQTVLKCPDAPAATCTETKKARWTLRRAVSGGGAGTAGCSGKMRGGTRRADVLVAGVRGERLFGRGGHDVVRGRGGKDCLDGGPGADRLFGNAGDDLLVGGAGKDVIEGGVGRDTIRARDRDVDRIRCGPGRDVVYVDRVDRHTGCEIVRRA